MVAIMTRVAKKTGVVIAIKTSFGAVNATAKAATTRAATRAAAPDAPGATPASTGTTSADGATATTRVWRVRSAPRAQVAGIALPAPVIGAAKPLVSTQLQYAACALHAHAAPTEQSGHAGGSAAARRRAAPERARANRRISTILTALSAQAASTPTLLTPMTCAIAPRARTAGPARIATNAAPWPTPEATQAHARSVQMVSTKQDGTMRTAAPTHFQGVDRASTSSTLRPAPVAPAPPARRANSRRPTPIHIVCSVKIVTA